jgi:hypothetical protein
MIVNEPAGDGKPQMSDAAATARDDLWTAAKRREAYVAVAIAATKQVAATRTLGYMIRAAMAHGLSLEDVCRAGNLNPPTVRELSDPATA